MNRPNRSPAMNAVARPALQMLQATKSRRTRAVVTPAPPVSLKWMSRIRIEAR